MEIFIYFIIFIIGSLIGSFCTLAVYRIPLGKDITHEQSFCPNCNHKLNFLDLIPIFSYVFLRGKCRYCGKKIRIRYLILEIFSGLVTLLFAISLKTSFVNIEIYKLIYFIFGMLYIVSLTLIAGIDKERKQVQKSVLVFGIIISIIYIIYLYIVKSVNIHRYVIYLFAMFIILVVDTICLRKKQKINYTIQVLTLCVYMLLFTNTEAVIYSIALALIFIAIKNIKSKKDENLPVAYYLAISNITILILQNFLLHY